MIIIRGFQRVCCVQNRLDLQCSGPLNGPVRILTAEAREKTTDTDSEGGTDRMCWTDKELFW